MSNLRTRLKKLAENNNLIVRRKKIASDKSFIITNIDLNSSQISVYGRANFEITPEEEQALDNANFYPNKVNIFNDEICEAVNIFIKNSYTTDSKLKEWILISIPDVNTYDGFKEEWNQSVFSGFFVGIEEYEKVWNELYPKNTQRIDDFVNKEMLFNVNETEGYCDFNLQK